MQLKCFSMFSFQKNIGKLNKILKARFSFGLKLIFGIFFQNIFLMGFSLNPVFNLSPVMLHNVENF